MLYYLAAGAGLALGLLVWYWRRSFRSVAILPGPPSGSWLVGNIPNFERAENAAEADFEWTKTYGSAFRFKGCFGEDILYVSDPKALQYILNTSGYNFPKSWELRVRIQLVSGPGLPAVEGTQHARHRRIMNPSFSHSALKGLIPLFADLSRKTTTAWTAMIRKQNTNLAVVDVLALLNRTTLDVIGEAALGYKFNSIEGVEPETELHKAYQNLFADANYMVSDFSIVFRRLLAYAPLWLVDYLTSLPKSDLKRLKNYMAIARKVAKTVVDKQMHAQAAGKEGGKDVMSIFVKANSAEDPKRRLEEEEIQAQIITLMLAGHDTSANTLSWLFYELSRHPDSQNKVRDEIRALREDVASRGDSEYTISDMDSMSYTIAVLKENLRLHPIVTQLQRRAGHDDVIPLSFPQQTVSGDTITAIPVRKGQVVQIGLASYNRLEAIWGQDAQKWRPERFLEDLPKENKINLGIYGNLLRPRSAAGCAVASGIWRFSILEMQAVLIELVENFEFSPAPNIEIKRVFTGALQGMVKGREEQGVQMPIQVSILPKQDEA